MISPVFSARRISQSKNMYSLKTTALAATMKGIGEIILLHVVPEGEDTAYPEAAVKTAERRISEICDHLIIQVSKPGLS